MVLGHLLFGYYSLGVLRLYFFLWASSLVGVMPIWPYYYYLVLRLLLGTRRLRWSSSLVFPLRWHLGSYSSVVGRCRRWFVVLGMCRLWFVVFVVGASLVLCFLWCVVNSGLSAWVPPILVLCFVLVVGLLRLWLFFFG